MRREKGMILLLPAAAVILLLINCFVFRSSVCDNEYLQSSDVWGRRQTVSVESLRTQQRILDMLSSDTEEAFEQNMAVLTDLKAMQRARNKYTETPEKEEKMEEDYFFEVSVNVSDYEDVQQILNRTLGYGEYIRQIMNNTKAISEVSLFNGKWKVDNAEQCRKDFYGLDNYRLSPVTDNVYNALINYRLFDLAALILALSAALFTGLYCRRTISGIGNAGGRGILVGASVLLLGTAGMYLADYRLAERYLGSCALRVRIQSFNSFRCCPFNISAGGLLFCIIGMKLSFYLLIYLISLSFVVRGFKDKRSITSAAAAVIVLAAEFVLSRMRGNAPVTVFFREINVFSALSFERFFNEYLNLNIASNAVSRLPVFLSVWTVIAVALAALSISRLRSCISLRQQQVQAEYYAEIDSKYEETRRLWHDFNNHLLIIRELIDNGCSDEADNYLQELKNNIERNHLIARTGCNPVDYLLAHKKQTAYSQATELELNIGCRLEPEEFAAYDLCCVIGNLIDNALEAVETLESDKRRIEFTLKRQQGMLFISCGNPFEGERTAENGHYRTTKQTPGEHGIGLSSIERVCRKYNGVMQINSDDGSFVVRILLMGKG